LKENLTIGIAGLGLIGGSLAKAFRRIDGIYIVALDNNPDYVKKALSEKVIDEGTSDDYKIFRDSDIVFIATPIFETVKAAIKINQVSGALITDTASTKKKIFEELPEDIRFIGGHPMAGSEKSGYSASSETLYENAVYALCKRDNNEEDLNLIRELVEKIGAIPLILDYKDHDRAVGMISHLPHILAASLVNLTKKEDKKGILGMLAAGGFKDLTRIASSDNNLWEQILISSEDTIIDILDNYIEELRNLENNLIARKSGEIKDYLLSAKIYRNNLSNAKKGLIGRVAELIIDVSDEPGIIGSVATLLGRNNLNIKNLYIENSREFEGGCLRITLENNVDLSRAVKVLTDNGYSARAR